MDLIEASGWTVIINDNLISNALGLANFAIAVLSAMVSPGALISHSFLHAMLQNLLHERRVKDFEFCCKLTSLLSFPFLYNSTLSDSLSDSLGTLSKQKQTYFQIHRSVQHFQIHRQSTHPAPPPHLYLHQ